jgi:ribosomal protein L40E
MTTDIHAINASLYDTCTCGASKPITSTVCLECFMDRLATKIEKDQ